MTGDNRRLHIQAALERGQEALKAAEMLLEVGLFNESVARYYATFYLASAALLSVDATAKSHHGLMSQFSLKLVRPGLLPVHMLKDLRRLQGFREAADYDFDFRFDRQGAEEEAVVARRLVADIRSFLSKEGLSKEGDPQVR